ESVHPAAVVKRLAQQWPSAMNRREHVGATGGHEHERDATRREFVGQWKTVLAPQINVEASHIDLHGLEHPQRSADRIRGPNDGSPRGRQGVLKCVCHQVAVFDNQHALAFQGGTPPNAGKVVPARHETGSNYFCTSTHIFCNGEPKPMTMNSLEK